MDYKIPDKNNLYGIISNIESKRALADMFGASGWRVGKANWTDFEVMIDWGEIIIESDEYDLLINGVVDPEMFDEFRKLLDSFGVKYVLELYDENGNLIKEVKTEN